MNNLPTAFDSLNDNDTPLPLLVAKRWNFLLTHVSDEEDIFYSIPDWIRGLTGEDDVSRIWSKFKKQEAWK